MSADSFGIPDSLLGPHPEQFYGALGRMVALSALLENELLTLHQALMGSQQNEHTKLSAADLVSGSKTRTVELGRAERLGPQAVDEISGFLAHASELLAARNDYVHNVWPAQPDGRLFGWRPQRNKDSGDQHILTDTTLANLLPDLRAVAELLERWPRVYGFVSARRHVQGGTK